MKNQASREELLEQLNELNKVTLELKGALTRSRKERGGSEAEKFRAIFEHSPLAIMCTDAKGSITNCNARASKLFGAPAEKLIGFSYKQIKDDRMREAIGCALTGENSRFDGEYLTVTGNVEVQMRANFSPSLAADGSVSGVIGIFEDVGDRKQAEEKLKSSQKRLAAVKEIGELATSSPILDVVLERILAGTIKAIDASVGMIFLKDPDTGLLKWGASLGLSDEFVAEYRDQHIKSGEGLTGRIVKEGKPIYIAENSSGDPRVVRAVVAREKLNSFIGVPLHAAEKIIGVMNILTRQPDTLDEQDIPLVTAVGAHVGSAIRNAQIFRQLQQTEISLQEKQDFMDSLINSLSDTFFVFEPETGRAIRWNNIFREISGYTDAEIAAQKAPDSYYSEEDLKRAATATSHVLNKGKTALQMNLITKDGRRIPFEYSAALARNPRDGNRYIIAIGRDLTERKKMEAELLKFHKLESLGVLAGGIAHDFNNLLTAIMGNISLAKMHAPAGETVCKFLTEAEKASSRAQDLTQQLLTFSKGGAPVKETSALDQIIRDAAGFATRGAKTACDFELPDDLWLTEVDTGQISQVFHNLLLNGVQAMPGGGRLKVRADNVTLTENTDISLAAGKYVKISITDQGQGIPRAHINNIFDPYFSTKHQGSGLGLATAYSITKNHNGLITVQSRPGQGTTFHVYLPASELPQSPGPPVAGQKSVAAINKKILVMDDEEDVRKIISAMLNRLGCSTVTAPDGLETVRLYREAVKNGRPFDAVILDLTIPGGLGGKETMTKLLAMNREIKAVVSSGYSNDPIMAYHKQYGFKERMAKPYTIESLLKVLQNLFAGAPPKSGEPEP